MSTCANNPAPAGGWTRFWFTPADPTTLGLIRIFAGLAALAIHVAYCWDLQEFFGKDAWFNLQLANEVRREAPVPVPQSGWQEPTPALIPDPQQHARIAEYVQKWGVHPDLAHAHGTYAWSIWFHVTDPAAMAWLHGGVLLVLALFTLGFCTRLTAIGSWIAALNYVHRSPTTLFGMDQILTVLLLYLALGPSGAALSLDRWLARRGWSWARFFGGSTSAVPAPSVSANFALRLMQVHFVIIYGAAGLSKLLGGSWWNGTALWWTVANYEFTPFRFAWYAGALRWLCEHRPLWELAMTGGVVYTLALEIAFPFLVWRPRWRWLMVSGAVLLHTVIAFVMGLVGFGMCMLALVFSFVPGEVVRAWLEGRPEQSMHPARAGGECVPSPAQAA